MATYRVVPRDSRVGVDGKSTGHAMHARSSELSGTLEVTLGDDGKPDLSQPYSATLSFPSASLSAGAMADRELRRRLDVERFPTIRIAVGEAREMDNGAYSAVAEVTAKGTTKRFEGDVSFTHQGDAIVVEGSQVIDMRDFGIEPPKLLMLKVDPMVTVNVVVTARPES